MPIALDPEQITLVTVDPEEVDPAKKRLVDPSAPAFLSRFLTHRQLQRIEVLRDEAHVLFGLLQREEAVAKVVELAGISLVGWQNFTDVQGNPVQGAFSPERISEVLTVSEIQRLGTRIIVAVTMSESDRFFSRLPSPIPGDGSASASRDDPAPGGEALPASGSPPSSMDSPAKPAEVAAAPTAESAEDEASAL